MRMWEDQSLDQWDYNCQFHPLMFMLEKAMLSRQITSWRLSTNISISQILSLSEIDNVDIHADVTRTHLLWLLLVITSICDLKYINRRVWKNINLICINRLAISGLEHDQRIWNVASQSCRSRNNSDLRSLDYHGMKVGNWNS